MTITFDRNQGEFTLAHSGNTRSVRERDLVRLANAQGWGDIEVHIEAAKQNPGIAITVDNRSRVPKPRFSRVYAVAQ